MLGSLPGKICQQRDEALKTGYGALSELMLSHDPAALGPRALTLARAAAKRAPPVMAAARRSEKSTI